MTITRTPGMMDEEWDESKRYFLENPEEAKMMQTFFKDSKAVKSLMIQKEITNYYADKLRNGDQATASKLVALERDPELSHVYADGRKTGSKAISAHSSNQHMMAKFSKHMGGVPKDLQMRLRAIQARPVTIQEACRDGNVAALREFVRSQRAAGELDLELADSRGVTCLGHAVGANRIGVVKVLLELRADHTRCDEAGSSALHYAAGYGRKELLEFFVRAGTDVNARNAQGLTPLALAAKNGQQEMSELLTMYGGEM
mmetsp:Transcript_18798/g.27982  ORF Transcript_18798/g.27982 Transcript_18798/m.27982 type:complete len:258 (-) Transcript_18798:85-858(-)